MACLLESRHLPSTLPRDRYECLSQYQIEYTTTPAPILHAPVHAKIMTSSCCYFVSAGWLGVVACISSGPLYRPSSRHSRFDLHSLPYIILQVSFLWLCSFFSSRNHLLFYAPRCNSTFSHTSLSSPGLLDHRKQACHSLLTPEERKRHKTGIEQKIIIETHTSSKHLSRTGHPALSCLEHAQNRYSYIT